MTPERWQRLQELFDAVMELDPDQRAAFLHQECADDPALRQQAESLIMASDDATLAIKSPIQGIADLVVEGEAVSVVGRRIGPYQVVQELGQGGMGAVYLAMRADDEYRKRVAIKVVKRDLADKEILRRFLNERQILASLDHPNIARLLDGGSTPEGLPYVVMEYVEGEPIDQYCDHHNLSIDERLELFRSVCSAVHYAHQNLVVHRDLKPGNILVTADGVPKLLDFGIAKLLNPELAPRTQAVTGTAMRLMTPEYASPEQVRGESITTASDIYSLGVVLYELLTRHRPYEFKNYLAQEIERVISQEEPERPSSAVSHQWSVVRGPWSVAQDNERSQGTNDKGQRTKDKLRKRLSGELDAIVMMALRKEPQRRYASVQQFSEDIRRHLEGRPVVARPDTFRYRAAKFVQRNRAWATAAGLVVLTLIGGILATAWEAQVARRERARAEHRFNDVRRLANSFLFEFHDAIKKLPGSTPAQELVVKRALEYLDSLAHEASGDLSLQRELAVAYRKVGDIQGHPYLANVGDTAGALQSYRKSLGILEKLAAADPASVEIRWELSASYERVGDGLLQAGDTTGSLENHRRALEIREALVVADAADAKNRRALSVSYTKMGDVSAAIGDTVGALEYHRKSLAIDEALLAADPTNAEARRGISIDYEKVGNMLAANGDTAGALEYYRKSLAIDEARATADPTNAEARRDLSIGYYKIANMLARTGDTAAALEYHRKSLTIAEELAAVDPTNAAARRDVAIGYIKIGDVLMTAEQMMGALEYYRKALDILQAMSATNPGSAEARRDLSYGFIKVGDVLAKSGDPTQALRNYHQAHTIRETLVANDPRNADYRSELAAIYSKFGDVYATWASRAGTSVRDQIERWHQAVSWYQKSLDVWLDMRNRGILSGEDANEPDAVFRELAKSKMALSKLQRH